MTMMELVTTGSIEERAWGATLFALALRGETGQLTIDVADKRYCIAFERGAIVGASSPLASDAAARIALTSHLVTSSQVAEIAKRMAAAPERDEVELIAETIELSVEQAEMLRRRVIAQRAARTFAFDTGTFTAGDRIRVPIVPGVSVDVRAVVYLGAHMHLSNERLAAELRKLGTHFTLTHGAADDIPAFGFTDLEKPVVKALRGGASLPELEAMHREVDPRTLHAVVYALATCGAVTCVTVARTPTPATVSFRARGSTNPGVGRTPTPTTQRIPAISRTPSPGGRTPTPNTQRTPTPNTARTPTPNTARAPTPNMARAPTPSAQRAPTPNTQRTPTPNVARAATTPAVTGRVPTAPDVGRAPTALAVTRAPTPHQPPTIGRAPAKPIAARTPTVNPPVVGRTPTPDIAVGRTPTTEEAKALATEAFTRGERLLATEQIEAAIPELARAASLTTDVDYAATLAWARFCVAPDRVAVGDETRKTLERAVYKSPKPAGALFYLGRVERMLGRDKEALRHFLEVLALQPTNSDAASEVRVLEARIAAHSKR
jgi:hypothetical protein